MNRCHVAPTPTHLRGDFLIAAPPSACRSSRSPVRLLALQRPGAWRIISAACATATMALTFPIAVSSESASWERSRSTAPTHPRRDAFELIGCCEGALALAPNAAQPESILRCFLVLGIVVPAQIVVRQRRESAGFPPLVRRLAPAPSPSHAMTSADEIETRTAGHVWPLSRVTG
jgi:hypothetical protein